MRPWSSITDNRKIVLLTFWFQMGLKNIQQVFWNVHFRLVNIRTYYIKKCHLSTCFQTLWNFNSWRRNKTSLWSFGIDHILKPKKKCTHMSSVNKIWSTNPSILPYCLLTSVCPQSTEAETLSTQLPTQLGQWIILFTFPSS